MPTLSAGSAIRSALCCTEGRAAGGPRVRMAGNAFPTHGLAAAELVASKGAASDCQALQPICTHFQHSRRATPLLKLCSPAGSRARSPTCSPPQLMEASSPATVRAALGPLSRRRSSDVMQGVKLCTCCRPKDRPKLRRRMRTNRGALQRMREGCALGSLRAGGRSQACRGDVHQGATPSARIGDSGAPRRRVDGAAAVRKSQRAQRTHLLMTNPSPLTDPSRHAVLVVR